MRFFSQQKEIKFCEFSQTLPKEAQALASILDLEADFEVDQKNRLFLLNPHSGPISISIDRVLNYHRKFFFKNSIYNEPLARALGVKKGQKRPCVLDATAGSLKDSLLIHAFGCKVYACERHPVAQALILNALDHCSEEMTSFAFYPQDASSWIATNQQDLNECDVIYFDPMYEHKNDKALPRKEMRIFREVVGTDSDAKECALSLKRSKKRLVIKQSSKASPLLGAPSMVFGSKSTRYNVYL